MPDHDTTIPGSPEFPSTVWSRLLRADRPSEAARWLVDGYWKPAYLYVRRRWKRSNEDAKDLTQGFFLEVLEKDFLSKADPARGSFRKFLRVSLENYLRNATRDAQALKRGGGVTFVPLDALAEADAAMARAGTPDELFDREWVEAVFERCLPKLKAAYASEGRPGYFEVFRRYDLEPSPDRRPTYEQLAEELGRPATDVRNWLVHARARWKKLIREELQETTSSGEALEGEMRELFMRG